jgi:hypothetical protein
MQKSEDENLVAIISGKNLIMNEQKQNQLFLLKKKKAPNHFQNDQFIYHKRIRLKDLEFFK